MSRFSDFVVCRTNLSKRSMFVTYPIILIFPNIPSFSNISNKVYIHVLAKKAGLAKSSEKET